MSLIQTSCPRCHSPLPKGGIGICAACSVGNLFGLESPSPSIPKSKSKGLFAGKYELGELIGEGGFGLVFRAEQKTPVKREIAIKILKEGTDRTRFEAEGQALASLNHPGIAKIFDSGIDEEGTPFLVMEFVPGAPITAKKRPIESSLLLFTDF